MGDNIELINFAEREALIRNIAYFSQFTASDIGALAALMTEAQVNAGEPIVKEGDLIDSVYIVASGTAEVTRQVSDQGPSGMLLATLSQGDSIGLNATGLYSATGTRTATVTATTPCVLLQLNLVQYNDFLNKNPHLITAMRGSVDWIVRIQFIKDVIPFSQISNKRMAWLASLVKEVTFNQDEIIFKEGEIADCCYLLREGKMQITRRKPDGGEDTLAILEAPRLFGEAALLTSVRRNATARAATFCKLLLLDQETLLELTSQEGSVAKTLISLVIERSRPIRVENIIHHQRVALDGQKIITLKNPLQGNYLQLTEEGWFIWQQLNGEKTTQELTTLFHQRFNRFDPSMVLSIISLLHDKGFAYLDASKVRFNEKDVSEEKPSGFFSFLNAKYVFNNTDKFITRIYNQGIFLFLSPPMIMLYLIIIAGGFATFLLTFKNVITVIPTINHIISLLVGVTVISMTLRILHPIAQAMTIKKLGYEVPNVGIGWNWIGPVAIVDTSDMWMSPRLPRIIVNLSGIMADLSMAALLSIYAYSADNNLSALFSWLCALFIYLQTLRNLNPLLDLDGYQILIGVLDAPNLRDASTKWLANLHISSLSKPSLLFKQNKQECIFWLYSLAYLFIIAIITLIFEIQLLQGTAGRLPYLLIIIFGLIIGSFCMEIWLEIRLQKKLATMSDTIKNLSSKETG